MDYRNEQTSIAVLALHYWMINMMLCMCQSIFWNEAQFNWIWHCKIKKYWRSNVMLSIVRGTQLGLWVDTLALLILESAQVINL